MKSLFLAVLVVAMFLAATENNQASSRPEQVHFSAEDSQVEKPVAIPQAVLALLKNDPMVRGALEETNRPSADPPETWFSAAVVHLNTAKKQDIVVMGEAPLSGGNSATFWVFSAKATGYQLVLATAAHDLVIKSSRSNGYRDIELTTATASVVSTILFHFNSTRYIEYRSKSNKIP